MATFVVVPTTESDVQSLDGTIRDKYGNKAYRLPRGEWLVSYEGTSLQLSVDLGIGPEVSPTPFSAIVLNFSSYWGRASKDIWEWMSVNGAR